MRRGLKVKSPNAAFAQNRVNLAGYKEAIYQPLYDYQTKTAAATQNQRFFLEAVGQNGKTLADTNMELSGQIPKGQAFLITGVQVELYPGPGIQVAIGSPYADDVIDFYKSGYLTLKIGSKDYITQGNLMKFPPVNRLGSQFATGASEAYVYAAATGREFAIKDLLLESNQNFSVELNDLASISADARVGVTLNGFLYRNAQ